MLFTFWISNPCCVLIVCTVMRDGHDPHLPVDVVNKSLEKKEKQTDRNTDRANPKMPQIY